MTELHRIHTELHEVKAGINKLAGLITEGFKTMADQSKELQTAFDDLSSAVTKIATDIDNQLKVIATPGTPDAAVSAAIKKAQDLTASLKAKATELEADDPPPTP